MSRRSLLIAIALLVVPAHALRAEFVVNGSLTGPTGFQTVPAPWFAPDAPGLIFPPSTLPPGGLQDGGGSTLAPQMPASPDGGTFVVVTAEFILDKSLARQTIVGLTPGQQYTLSFHYANAGADVPIPGNFVFPGSILATIAGQTFETDVLDYLGPGEQVWRLASFSFTANAASTNLDLHTIDAQFFGAIDGVSIVPEPSSCALGAVGLVICGAWRRRRR